MSLLIGKHIYSVLTSDEDVSSMIGERVYLSPSRKVPTVLTSYLVILTQSVNIQKMVG